MIINEENYVAKADQTIGKMNSYKDPKSGKPPRDHLSTSQIRNLLSMSADIYNMVMDCNGDAMTEDILSKIQYLKIRMVYESGRTPAVKRFIDIADLLKIIDEIGKSKKNYILYAKYMEALVAYHRFYGGKDN